ncbi:MAG TPA: glycosyltransferase family A protein [Lutibacter sp.]
MPNKQPLVTVILPVYNGEKTLKATLESLLQQTFADFELLIGIDGTKDGSKDIAAAFKDERIQIFENAENIGLGPNVNKLISLASSSSKYIAMAEQDDVYVPDRLQWQVEVMEQQPEVGFVSGIAEFVSDTSNILFPGLLVQGKQFPQGEELFRFLYINQLKVVNTCMMLRKRVHQNHQLTFIDKYPNMNVDWDYVLRFSLVSKVYGIPKKLVSMNRRSVNQSVTTDKWKQFETSRQLLLDFKEEFPSLISRKDYRDALKMERKIELGYRSKVEIIVYSIYYFIVYFDTYFLKYIKIRVFKYLRK